MRGNRAASRAESLGRVLLPRAQRFGPAYPGAEIWENNGNTYNAIAKRPE